MIQISKFLKKLKCKSIGMRVPGLLIKDQYWKNDRNKL
jgi:hypothetical protein